MTLAKGLNFLNPEDYAEIFNKNKFDYLEIKGALPIGGAMYRLSYEHMPQHNEIIKFAKKISKLTNLKIIDGQPISTVVLMGKENKKDRFLN